MKRPKRLSIGTYGIVAGGRTIVLQRVGRSGFKIVMRPGALSPLFRRLRGAAAVAAEAASPWPFDVAKVPDLDLDMPIYLRRIPATGRTA